MIVDVKVEGQTIKWFTGSQPIIATDSIEFINFRFAFSSDWGDCTIVAQFTQKDITYDKLLINGKCTMPSEITEGMCSISCFGVIAGDVIRATATPLYFSVARSGFISDGKASIPPTPDLYSQYVAQVQKAINNAIPLIKDGMWWLYDVTQGAYINTGIVADLTSGLIETKDIHSRDIYVGGYFDEEGNWKDSVETSSSLSVSGTVRLLGEVHADKASFHTHHMNVDGELKVTGDAKFDHDVRMTHSLKVDSKIDVGEGATIRGTLDMKQNDVKNIQSLEVEGTADLQGDVKIKYNTNKETKLKLSDVLNEALDYQFKSRVYIDLSKYGNFAAAFTAALNEVGDGGVIAIPSGEYTLNATSIFSLTKDLTIIGIGKIPPTINYIVGDTSGTGVIYISGKRLTLQNMILRDNSTKSKDFAVLNTGALTIKKCELNSLNNIGMGGDAELILEDCKISHKLSGEALLSAISLYGPGAIKFHMKKCVVEAGFINVITAIASTVNKHYIRLEECIFNGNDIHSILLDAKKLEIIDCDCDNVYKDETNKISNQGIFTAGSLEGNSIILQSPNGNSFNLTLNDAGELIITQLNNT